MSSLRERFERGHAMRVQRAAEGALLVASIVGGSSWPAIAACALLALQLVSPLLSPFGLLWLAVERPAADHLGRIYYDLGGSRGAAGISMLVIGAGLLAWQFGHATVGRWLLCPPAASCLLSATVGFCAGCGYYVLGRDLLGRFGLVPRNPEGASDVVLDKR